MNKIRVKTAALPVRLPARFWLALAAIVLALLALPHVGHAQGIVRGDQEGSYEGNRVAGPVGGVVGGAVGAGVGGAVGAVEGVLGLPTTAGAIAAAGITATADFIVMDENVARMSASDIRDLRNERPRISLRSSGLQAG